MRWADGRGLPVLILGGGSNVVIADRGWDGLVVRIATRGRRFEEAAGVVTLTAAAGEPWDDVVAEAVARDCAGLECLSGIPGLVGATPIQNVGAYGQEVADTIRSVKVLERASGRVRELPAEACAFAYRDSAFKRAPDRHVVLAVTFALRPGGAPTLRYRELADALGGGARPTLAEVRATVLALRRKKSMVIVDGDPNRRSVGSFFMNPIVRRRRGGRGGGARGGPGRDRDRRRDAPLAGAGRARSSCRPDGSSSAPASTRAIAAARSACRRAHALALVHHGGGSTAALLELAREVSDAVHARFGMTLMPEPTLIGTGWPTPRS